MAEDQQMQDLVRAEVARLAENAQVAQDYPDLQDRNSKFFQKTAVEFRNLPEQMPGRVRVAAERVELEMRKAGTWKDPEPAGGGAAASTESNDEPSELQASIAHEIIGGDRAKAVAAYKEQANRGVNISSSGPLGGLLNRER